MSVTITDLFCGAGGSSIGAELAGATLRLGLNHWDRAVETHAANFQHADHDCEDVASLTTSQIRRYPDSDILLASPECTNHSLAKGARRRKPQAASLFDDGPAGDDAQDRSRATMWDVCRFAEQKIMKGRPYKAIVVENVVDAFKWGPDDNGQLFSAWLQAMRALGYEHEIVWLNSMLAGWVPQSRNRMYVVFWLKTMRAPNLRIEPIAWCPTCEQVVNGRQTWKKPGARIWGSYGQQYFYTCHLGHTCIPGAPPAAEAIDWTLPIQTIGERKPTKCRQCGKRHPIACSTRERVRRGIIRLADEPFAIRLLQSGAPKTLSLPLVTLTTRHDMAMVMPVAANTYERTPGNRADDAATTPLRAMHGTLDRALVVPPMGDVAGRSVMEPAPTQTTTTRAALVVKTGHRTANGNLVRAADTAPLQTLTTAGETALVMANTENAVPRPAGQEPTHALRTEGGMSMVIANRHGARGRHPDVDQVPTLCSAEGIAFVLRNNTARGDGGQMATPSYEPIRTLTGAGHQSLVVPFATRNVPHVATREPVSTVTAGGEKLALVVPYDSSGNARLAGEEPAPTLTTRDRAAVVVTDEDIEACGFRMFALHEIAVAMAMHAHPTGGEYVVLGNKEEQMAQYGNAVTPPAMQLIVERLLEVVA